MGRHLKAFTQDDMVPLPVGPRFAGMQEPNSTALE
jgi:hypothetical protein